MGKKGKSRNKTTSNSSAVEEKQANVKSQGTEEKVTSSEMHVEHVTKTEIKTKEDDSGISTSVKSNEAYYKRAENNKNDFQQESSQRSGNFNKNFQQNYTDKPRGRWSEPHKNRNNERGDSHRSSYHENTNSRRQDYKRNSSGSRDRRRKDSEFEAWEKEFKSNNGRIEYIKTNEIEGDLFEMSKEYSLAHCVAEDMSMGSGIAVLFRREFKKVDELLNQRQRTGGLAILKDGDRYIYYLVTKRLSSGKPTNASLFASLKRMREHVTDNRVRKLAMPRIGCGLDRLEWVEVKYMIEFIFRDVDIEIVVCNLVQTEESPQIRHKNSRLTDVEYPIWEIEPGTVIVYLSTEDEYVSKEMEMLDGKFHFLKEFRFAKKIMGNVIYFKRNENYLLCGCIVKKTEADIIDFKSFQKCLYDIQKENRKVGFNYIGFQAIEDQDGCINYKIINLLRNTMRGLEVYVCWPGDLQKQVLAKERSSDSFRQEKNRTDGDNWRNRAETGNRSFDSRDRSLSRNDRHTSSFQLNTNINHQNDVESDHQFNRSQMNESSSKPEIDWFEDGNQTLGIQNVPQIIPSVNDAYPEMNTGWDVADSGEPTPNKRSKTSGCKSLSKNDEGETDPLYVDQSQKSDHQTPDTTHQLQNETSNVNIEFETFQEKRRTMKLSVIREKEVNSLPTNSSRCWYVTEDMSAESIIPYGTNINRYLGRLLNQNQKEGNVAFERIGDDYLYYLIVKQNSTTVANPQTVFTSIQKMRDHAVENKVKKIIVPKVDDPKNCELKDVNYMLDFLFKSTGIEISVVPFTKEQRVKSKVTHKRSGLHQMKQKSVIIYLTSEDGHVSDEMKSLNKKFNFIEEFKNADKCIGEVIKHKSDPNFILYGCIVRREFRNPIDFVELEKCISMVNKMNKNAEAFSLVGIQAINDQDDSINFKIRNILDSNLKVTNIQMCWPGPLKEKMPSK